MTEEFLSFVWRYQHFSGSPIHLTTGEILKVLRVGFPNTHAGPDFSEVRLMLDGVEWNGSVEIHVKSSDWQVHQHTQDPAYESVILHVVWVDDRPVKHQDGTKIPTLVLHDKVDPSLRQRFDLLMQQTAPIPCAPQFAQVEPLPKLVMLDRVLLERLEARAQRVTELWEQNQRDWEETAYHWLALHFGFKLNSPAFLRLAQTIPLKVIQKHRSSASQVEALLYGASGLLPAEAKDPYTQNLQKEYAFLSAKFGLEGKELAAHEWKFLRLRPAGFPTIRLAQWGALLQRETGLFAALTTVEEAADLQKMFRVSQSDYWKKHYQFGKESTAPVPSLGRDAADLLIINAAVPLLVAYSRQRDLPHLLERAIHWLESLRPENNYITRIWGGLGMKVAHAADSQALLEWHNHYCTPRRCLECQVGASLLRSPSSG